VESTAASAAIFSPIDHKARRARAELGSQKEEHMTSPFKPMTKEDVARALQCSVRNIEKLIQSGGMPGPGRVAGRSFWHPNIFYEWLDAVLRQTAMSSIDASESAREKTSDDISSRPKVSRTNKPTNAIDCMQTRQANKLNFN